MFNNELYNLCSSSSSSSFLKNKNANKRTKLWKSVSEKLVSYNELFTKNPMYLFIMGMGRRLNKSNNPIQIFVKPMTMQIPTTISISVFFIFLFKTKYTTKKHNAELWKRLANITKIIKHFHCLSIAYFKEYSVIAIAAPCRIIPIYLQKNSLNIVSLLNKPAQ